MDFYKVTAGDLTTYFAGGVPPQGAVEISEDDFVEATTAPPALPVTKQTIFPARQLMETLFTAAEQQAIFQAAQTPAGWEIFKFVTYTAATPQIDVTDPEFVADIGAVEAAGLLTAARASQVLAGTTAPTG